MRYTRPCDRMSTIDKSSSDRLSFERPRSLVHSIVRALSEAIWSGRIAPGAKILEEQIAREFGTSRSPVREALRVLASKGLVEIQPHRGARVIVITENSK